jgi:hypothetical protein
MGRRRTVSMYSPLGALRDMLGYMAVLKRCCGGWRWEFGETRLGLGGFGRWEGGSGRQFWDSKFCRREALA